MFDLDQLQSIMNRINGSANDLFSAPVSISQIQYRSGQLWVAYTVNGATHEMSVPVDQSAPVDNQLIYDLQTALVRAIKSVASV